MDLEITRATPYPHARMPDADLTKVRGAVTRLFQIRQMEHRESMLPAPEMVCA